MRNKVLSGMLGLAVGDALGVPVEFKSRAQLDAQPVRGMLGHGTHDQPAGTWSDDTTMALCTMEAITKDEGTAGAMQRFCRWVQEGYMTAHGQLFDIGMATRKAIMLYMQVGLSPEECGGRAANENGNGSLMRILPLAYVLAQSRDKDGVMGLIHAHSCLTHAHPRSQMACGIYCQVAARLILGSAGREAVEAGLERARRYYGQKSEFAGEMATFADLTLAGLQSAAREDIQSSGYVVHTLKAALWCLLHTQSYGECVLAAVNLGEDTDTTAAVAGGLAGLLYGTGGIEQEWLDTLAAREDIEELCRRFAMRLARSGEDE
ncbi:MAG: ADP-ribosylglycohydrolase family protein [Christensenellaceae bacterium]|nr:ADP-ribosylglycohydrolase family protein [Christensenellaceae bacterium]